MLKTWSITNFKPILDSGELKFAPVTVLAGRNSSGKSSLIQSILMVAQTLTNPVKEYPLLLNGTLIQLGTFRDILHEKSDTNILALSFEIESLPEKPSSVSHQALTVRFSSPDGSDTADGYLKIPNINVDYIGIKCNFEEIYSVNDEYLRAGNNNIKDNYEVYSNIERIPSVQAHQILKNINQRYLRLLSFSGEQSVYLAKNRQSNSNASHSFLVTLSHFLPESFLTELKFYPFYIDFEDVQNLEQYLLDKIYFLLGLREQDEADRFGNVIDFEDPLSEGLQGTIYDLCQRENIAIHLPIQSLNALVSELKSLSFSEEKGKKIADELRKAILCHLLREAESLEFIPDSSTLSIELAGSQIWRFFTSKIRYLSSLRVEPWLIQQRFAPTGEFDEVGIKGEYAAVVYHANKDARIEWYNPRSNQVEQGTLKHALDTWTQYLDVATQVETEVAGLSGITWKVVIKKGQKARTLPEVGGGVNHILPLLVMGLLAPANTFLIMEEPEVTLHPTVQARLGDFFMGLTKCKKQCLIETHSENLVNQLRYHIVQAGGMDKSDCLIYFVDQDEKGAARFEPVQISPQGNILNWPDGFFDETMQQEDRITAASIRKRASK